MRPHLVLLIFICAIISSVDAQEIRQQERYRMESLNAISKTEKIGLTKATPGPYNSIDQPGQPGHLSNFTNQFFIDRQAALCYDTSSRHFVRSDSVTYYSNTPYIASDGYLMVFGLAVDKNSPSSVSGFLMKTDMQGNVIWNKLYDSVGRLVYNDITYYKILELPDGSFLLGGATNNLQTNNDDLLITKVDANGNVIWSKNYRSRIWTYGNGSSDYFYIQDWKRDPYTGDVYLCGPHWAAGKALVKLNPTNGNIIWSNLYQYMGSTFDNAFGLDIRQNEIRYIGRLYSTNTFLNCIRIRKDNGDTLGSKMLKSVDTSGWKSEFLSADMLSIRPNGNYLVSGKCYHGFGASYTGDPIYQGTIAEIDSNFNFVKAYALKNPMTSNGYNTIVTVFPDGSGLMSFLHWYGGWTADLYYTQFVDGNIVKRRKKFYTNEGMPSENLALRMPDGSDMVSRMLGDSAAGLHKIEFLKMHYSDTSSACIGFDENLSISQPINYTSYTWRVDTIGYNVFSETPVKTITAHDHMPALLPGCFIVSHCDTLNLTATPAVSCPGQPITITIHKNEACGTVVPLKCNSNALSSVIRVNDTTYTFTFNAAWTGYISADLMGCTLMKDSVLVSVLQSPATLNLGPDATICPGNTIVLNALSGFASYLWQDGSSDSLFTVTQPGTYYVTTTNPCGASLSDTVHVTAHQPASFSAGLDRFKCNSDTIHLHATTGFSNYTWSPNYNITVLNAPNTVVYPNVDTSYYIKAEEIPGCFVYDTVRITVLRSAPVNFGPDQSICAEDSIVLGAGPNFSQYQWSNGMNTQQITVFNPGTYSFIGTASNGCKSYDTLTLLSLNPLPVVTLDPNPNLCAGTSRLLDAGPGFSNYSWSTGANSQSITATALGTYSVIVTDPMGCKGGDTINITNLFPSPAAFLPMDTAVCNYGSIRLRPLSVYPQYLWNTGSVNPMIEVSQPGLYWLQVRDQNNCLGKDSITVNPKECMLGFYMPNAFSPNNDGHNDVLRPLLFGKVRSYQFWVYNRWGEIVFTSTELKKGWDGRLNGIVQDGNIFAWVCRYQFEEGNVEIAKGVAVLIR